jgi:hypothetical protein
MQQMMELVGLDQGGPIADAAVIVNPSPDLANIAGITFHGSSMCIQSGPPPGKHMQ